MSRRMCLARDMGEGGEPQQWIKYLRPRGEMQILIEIGYSATTGFLASHSPVTWPLPAALSSSSPSSPLRCCPGKRIFEASNSTALKDPLKFDEFYYWTRNQFYNWVCWHFGHCLCPKEKFRSGCDVDVAREDDVLVAVTGLVRSGDNWMSIAWQTGFPWTE